METNENFKWCTSKKCGRIIERLTANDTPIACHCGVTHKSFRGIGVDEDQEWIKLNTKKCPTCKANIEKNDGCNQMTCFKCKYSFCWECLADWKIHGNHTGGYYKCNRISNNQTKSKS